MFRRKFAHLEAAIECGTNIGADQEGVLVEKRPYGNGWLLGLEIHECSSISQEIASSKRPLV
jgi:glycine cleavage system H lipoate-binding protein